MTHTVNIKPAYLERSDAARFLAMSETTMYRLGNEDPKFPRPRSLSDRRVAWLVRELEEWAESRPPADNLPPPNTGHGNRPRRARGRAPQDEHQAA
ncbi:MAG: helix-turn-helix transcriptional regulator [Hydrogenophaga sp.]|uniref:helix-turn-helix transcriptional regulator n=1 Tax=Hydrogenophaga sp. TaxID=1904254 RepID=UPI0040362228